MPTRLRTQVADLAPASWTPGKGTELLRKGGPEGDFLSEAATVDVDDQPAGPQRLSIRTGPAVPIRVLLGGKPFPGCVTLARRGGGATSIRTARASRQGVATFQAIAPGAYTVSPLHQPGFQDGQPGGLGGILVLLTALALPSKDALVRDRDVDLGVAGAISEARLPPCRSASVPRHSPGDDLAPPQPGSQTRLSTPFSR